MRTTLTLDDDVAIRLAELQTALGQSFKDVVNQTLRVGLERRARPATPPTRFTVKARKMGVRQGLNYANVGELLELLEGAAHR